MDDLLLRFEQRPLIVRHADRLGGAAFDQHVEIGGQRFASDDDGTVLGPLHQAGMGRQVKAGLQIPFAARLVARNAAGIENRENIERVAHDLGGGRRAGEKRKSGDGREDRGGLHPRHQKVPSYQG